MFKYLFLPKKYLIRYQISQTLCDLLSPAARGAGRLVLPCCGLSSACLLSCTSHEICKGKNKCHQLTLSNIDKLSSLVPKI